MANNKSHIKKSSSRTQRGRKTYYKYWIAALVVLVFYAFIFLTYFVSPFTTRWRALYGDVAYPEGYSIHGIDVSHHQGDIDWEKVSNAQIDKEPVAFVVIKATEGKSHLDVNFNENFYEARQYGLVRGAYHYFAPSVSGREQAKYYLHQVHLDEGDMPPILDIEECGKLTPEQLRREALEWLKEVEDCYEVAPVIYTGLKFKQKYLSTPEFDRYPFWIAHYYVKEVGYTGKWRFWQHTDLGKVDGIKGPVDLDVYNGSMYDLRHFLIGSGEEPLLPDFEEDETEEPALQKDKNTKKE